MLPSLRPRVFVVVIAVILGSSLCSTAGAQSRARPRSNSSSGNIPGSSLSVGQAVAIVAGVAAAIAVVAILVIHNKKSHTSSDASSITGCVAAGPNGKTLTDENEKRVYLLAGDDAAAKPGDRMTLSGKPGVATAEFSLVWNVTKVKQDYGACRP